MAGLIRRGSRERLRAYLRRRGFTTTCTVTLPVKGATDNRGGWAAGTPATVYDGIGCTVQIRTERDAAEQFRERLRNQTFVVIYLDADKVISTAHQITTAEGITYRVLGDPIPGSDALMLRVPAARITP